MLDQASELRKLVREAASANARPAPACVMVCGAGRGAGATSTAVALAKSLSRHGATVLLDAGPLAAATERLGPESLAGACEDVLAGRLRLNEVLEEAGENLSLAPSSGTIYAWQHEPAVGRLWRQLVHVDAQFAVLDAGSQWHAGMRAFYQGGAELLMVATSDPEHMLNAYALIKSLTHKTDQADQAGQAGPAGQAGQAAGPPRPADEQTQTAPIACPTAIGSLPSGRASLLVNRADEATATEIHERLKTACQRFLGKQIELLYTPDSMAPPAGPLPQAFVASPSWQVVMDVWADHLADVVKDASPGLPESGGERAG